jgi:bacillithiol biosynthesis cysteine-adding enzyme BshC
MSDLASFLPYREEHLEELLDRPHPAPRQALAQALEAYLCRLGAPPESLANARRIAHPKSRAVLTGQQAGLLGGPSFTFYKAHTALALAAAHDRAERPVAAVFWVASQDHDTQEVRWVRFLDAREKDHVLELPLPPARPVGRLPFAPYREQVREFLEGFGGIPEVRARIERTFEGSYSEVFARLLLEFLGSRGLVVFDPMAPELAPFFLPALRRELAHPLDSSEAINRTAQAMRALGLEPALGRGESATNLFLEGEDGIRRLLHYRFGRFDDGQRSYLPDELEDLLEEDPARITPAAGLRPVLQDTVLPTVALVVGPGELRYVAELGEVYRLHGLEPPAVIRRLSGVVLEPPVRRILDRYGLDPWAFQEEPEASFLKALLKDHLLVERLKSLEGDLMARFEVLHDTLAQLDPTLERPRMRAQRRIAHELERLYTKIARAELKRQELHQHHLERLRRHLLPQGMPQERVYPFVMYVLKHGPELLIRLAELPALGRGTLNI